MFLFADPVISRGRTAAGKHPAQVEVLIIGSFPFPE